MVALALVALLWTPAATAAKGELSVRIDPTFLTVVPDSRAPFEIFLQGEMTCEEGQPPAIRMVASQAAERNDNGTLWAFDRSSFLVNWSGSGSDRYTVDENVTRTVRGEVTPDRRVWSNVTWSALASGEGSTDPTGNGTCGWERATDAVAIVVPGPDDGDGEQGFPIPAPGIAATAAVLLAAAAWGRRRR